ncbi:hypothetical protein [Flavobacterium sp. HSC-61S13]|uniref:hypothetical protein n=1 Tax=Flavobacterium sp. HSC-61S13 TaxID=2910963 RepID=UPI0020A06E75|nr:hypothetical protein [Flavobacterium sp. HSC-61S13]MCP1996621.1 hypothetical protein [Flavobacterium sp. HSC-61S13]
MLKKHKLKECHNPDCSNTFKQYNSLQKYCSPTCQKTHAKPKRINKVSKKRKEDNEIYSIIRLEFLSKEYNQICFIEECNRPATSVEHTRGRIGYADDWARENDITLFLDVRFWKPCCIEHNLELENNSELSKKHQLSRIHGGKKT